MLSDAPSEWPKISVVTPSLNQAKYIEQAICSVLDQEYPNLEYILFDGGSTDGSVEIIEKYGDRITFWRSEPDAGQSNAINKGFQRATGELVAWLNCDDIYLPGALKTVAEAYKSQPGAPFYFGEGQRLDEQGNCKSTFFPLEYAKFNRAALIQGLNYILQPATFIYRPALIQAGYLDESLRYGMDTDLWIRLSALGEPVPVHAALAAQREYADTLTSKGMFKRVEELRAIAEKYSGEAATPGYFCYYFDTMHRFARQHPDVYPQAYVEEIESIWNSTAHLLAAFGAHQDGSPIKHRKIGIELRDVSLGISGGIAPLLKGVLGSMFLCYPNCEFYLFGTIYNQTLFPSPPKNVHCLSIPTSRFDLEINRIVRQENITVLFRSYPALLNLELALSNQVFFIPDIQHEVYPEFFTPQVLEARQRAFHQTMQGASAIGTLTGFSRKTISEHPDNRCQDIFLMPPAIDPDDTTSEAAGLHPEEIALLPQHEYFYFPGNLWPHKNHRRTLQAFETFLKQADRPMEMILTGHPEGWPTLKAEFPELPVRHLGFVRPAFVRYLYEHAVALVFFSLYEGFGIPLLEAFKIGTPVICSNVTCLPEVGGDAVLSCDPTDIEAMSQLMMRITQEKELRMELAARGKARLDDYSWEKSAHALMSAIQRAPKKRPGLKHPLPLVSIITPSYNQGRFLRRTIESVLTQSYPNIEYIVMDGKSTDESVEILKSYGDRFAWVSEADQGQFDAINKGFARSHGEILGFLNSDDTLMPDAIEAVVHYFQEHPEIDMVYGRAYYTDENDRITGMYATDEYSFSRLVWDNCVCQPAAFWRRCIADRVGEFDSSLRMVGDMDYWLRIAKAGGLIAHIHNILACSRLHSDAKTVTSRGVSIAEVFQVSQKHAGTVSLSYFRSLWHYRVWEEPNGRYRFLRHIPHSFPIMAEIHYAIYHRQFPASLKPRNLLGSIKRYLRRISTNRWSFGRPLVRWYRASHFIVSPAKPVFGLFSDNWLGPVFQVYILRKTAGATLYLRGIPTKDMLLNVRVEDRPSQTLELHSDEPIKIPVEADPGDRVVFYFQDSMRDSAGRNLSFLVQDTNLFIEQDLSFMN